MSKVYEDPWAGVPVGAPGPCHYGCGKQATMSEPGKPWKAHKVCSGALTNTDAPVIGWDGEDRESKAEPKPLGCGTPTEGQTSGRVCAGTGATPSCRLCPRSPNYWRNSLTPSERAALPG